MSKASPAAFLDRDGVITFDSGYVHKIDDFALLPDAVRGMRALRRLGYQLVVVTNQSGIARGLYSEAAYQAFTAHMLSQLTKRGVQILDVYFCPHHPTAGQRPYRIDCDCRKPKPGMILRAAREHRLDLSQSILIGDKESDLIAGTAAGVPINILLATDGRNAMASATCTTVLGASRWLQSRARKQSAKG